MIGPSAKETAADIVKLLADKDEQVRRKAAFALGGIAPEPVATIGPLIRLFADGNADVRQSASEAVAKFNAEAVPALIDALQNDSPAIRLGAIRTLGQIGSDAKAAVPHLKTRLIAGDAESADALARIGKPALAALADCIKQDNAAVRKQAVQALGKIGVDAVPTLVDLLADKNADVRQNAAAMLAPMRVSDKMVVLAWPTGRAIPIKTCGGNV